MSNIDNAKSYRIGIILGLGIGIFFLICGMVLVILGITGEINIVGETETFKASISNASPGIFFALCGVVITWRFKPKIEAKEETLVSQGYSNPRCPSCGKSDRNSYTFTSNTYSAGYKRDPDACLVCGGTANGWGKF